MTQRLWILQGILVCSLTAAGCTKVDTTPTEKTQPGTGKLARPGDSRTADTRPAAGTPRLAPDPRRGAVTASAADRNAVVKGANRFAMNLYAKVRARPGNRFLSPWSVVTALAMTYAGARNETQADMKRAMHYPLDQARLHPAFGSLDAAMEAEQKTGGYRLSIANRIWPKAGEKLNPAFLKTMADSYGARPQPLDYAGDLQGARATINRWVAAKTANKIKELLKKGDLSGAVRLVLTNAIYFKGKWARQFEKSSTRKGTFHVAPNKTARVDMMMRTARFNYAETADLQAVELPYEGKNISMLVLLPRQKDGMAALENTLTLNSFSAVARSLRPAGKVTVYLPRFKVRDRYDLVKTLTTMGMTLPFHDRLADFTGMLINGKKGDLVISKVIHEAVCEVDEEGTVAAAATAVAMIPGGAAPRPPKIFKADHPFLIILRHNKTGSILFMGRIENPTD